MLHIYIDTNVLVRFYAYSDDALTEIEKLLALIQSKAVHSYTTEQTIDEFYRNRDKELAEAIKRLEAIPASAALPRFSSSFEEAAKLTNALKEVKSAKATLIEKIKESLGQESLKADKIIDEIFEASECVKRTDGIISKAELRVKLGNPPGKSGIGDQINWESLIQVVPSGNDIHIISRDGDYSSKEDRSRISQFLLREWRKEKASEAMLYNGLSEFTQKHFPEIKVPVDAIKLAAIKKLVSSGSFSNTHDQISVLQGVFDEINKADAIVLLQAMIDNGQINAISKDSDVENFYKELYLKFMFDITSEMDTHLEAVADYFGIPF